MQKPVRLALDLHLPLPASASIDAPAMLPREPIEVSPKCAARMCKRAAQGLLACRGEPRQPPARRADLEVFAIGRSASGNSKVWMQVRRQARHTGAAPGRRLPACAQAAARETAASLLAQRDRNSKRGRVPCRGSGQQGRSRRACWTGSCSCRRRGTPRPPRAANGGPRAAGAAKQRQSPTHHRHCALVSGVGLSETRGMCKRATQEEACWPTCLHHPVGARVPHALPEVNPCNCSRARTHRQAHT